MIFGANAVFTNSFKKNPLYREAVLTSCIFFLHLGAPWIWVATAYGGRVSLAPWAALCGLTILAAIGLGFTLQNIDMLSPDEPGKPTLQEGLLHKIPDIDNSDDENNNEHVVVADPTTTL